MKTIALGMLSTFLCLSQTTHAAIPLAFARTQVHINPTIHYEKSFTADGHYVLVKPVLDQNAGFLNALELNTEISKITISENDIRRLAASYTPHCAKYIQIISVDFLSNQRMIVNDMRHLHCGSDSQNHDVKQFVATGVKPIDLTIADNISMSGFEFVKKVIANAVNENNGVPANLPHFITQDVRLDVMTATNKEMKFYPMLPAGIERSDWAASLSYETMKPFLLPHAPVLKLLNEANILDLEKN